MGKVTAVGSMLQLVKSPVSGIFCCCLQYLFSFEELQLPVHSDNGEMVVVTMSGEREVHVGTKHAAGKMKAGQGTVQ